MSDDWIRHALEDAVSDVEPEHTLDSIRQRTAQQHPRRGWVWAAGGAAAGVAATLVAIALLGGGDAPDRVPGPVDGPTATSSPTPSTAPSPDGPDGEGLEVPVYFLGELRFHAGEGGELQTGFRLYREWHRADGVDESSPSTEVAAAAVREMLRGEPDDPDYSSAWADGVDVTSVTHGDGVITVDLAGPVQSASVGSETAEMSVQQLVYTVQGALASSREPSPTDPVRILVDGAPAGDLWGHVDASEPIVRAAATGTQAPVWITAPAEGQTLTSPVTVEGVAQVFEANVTWRVLRGADVVEEGFATASAGAPEFGEFSFRVTLEPGTYTIEAYEASALDGSAISVDTKRITIEKGQR